MYFGSCPGSGVSRSQRKIINFIELNTSHRFYGSTYGQAYDFIGRYHAKAQSIYNSKKYHTCACCRRCGNC